LSVDGEADQELGSHSNGSWLCIPAWWRHIHAYSSFRVQTWDGCCTVILMVTVS